MESFKANLLIVIFIALSVVLGYWAIASLKTNSAIIVEEQMPKDVGPIVVSEPEPEPITQPVEEAPATPVSPSTPALTGLAADLQDLIDDNILMKKGSRGTRVGVVQKFLIEYGIDIDADNDYGDTTVNAVKKFQQEQKLSADGQAGPGTFEKMIDWLEAN